MSIASGMIALVCAALALPATAAVAAQATVSLDIRANAHSYDKSQDMAFILSQTVGPLVRHAVARAVDGPNGAHSDADFLASADFGNLSVAGSADADYGGAYGSATGLFLYAIGGAPNSQFTDRIFVSDAGLPAGTPISLRLRQSLVAAASLNIPNYRPLFGSNFVYSDLSYAISTVNTQRYLPELALGLGTYSDSSSLVISVPNGASVYIVGTLSAALYVYSPSVHGLAQGDASGHMLTQIDVLTHGASFTSSSGALYAPSPVPEPGAALMMLAGVVLLIGNRRRAAGSTRQR